MNKKQLPSKREIVPAPPKSVPYPRATFTDEFKRDAVSPLHSGVQPATDLAVELGVRRNQRYMKGRGSRLANRHGHSR